MPREVKGILIYHRGRDKRNKKITWKPETDLVAIQYFEVDENERVNVNKLKFENLRSFESSMEKAAIKSKSSMDHNDDSDQGSQLMAWYKPKRIKVTNREPFTPGENSKEKDIQTAREMGVLQEIYFSREMTPDTPKEAEPDTAPNADNMPTMVPLEDKEADENSEFTYANKGWPEPKENKVSQQASLESQFSLPPALSSLLSAINKDGFEAIIPPANSLSKEEQDTLAAQMEAMKKLDILPPMLANPGSSVAPNVVPNFPPPGPHLSPPQNTLPDFSRFPPPVANQGFPIPPPFGGSAPSSGNNGYYPPQPPPFGGYHRNGRGGGYPGGPGYHRGGPNHRGGHRDFRYARI